MGRPSHRAKSPAFIPQNSASGFLNPLPLEIYRSFATIPAYWCQVFRGTLFAPSDGIMGTNNSILAAYCLYSKEMRDGCHKGSLLSQSSKSFFTLQAGSSFVTASFLGFRPSSGQAVVEFTLVFLLFLVIVWIPADFGLAFYTGQLAQNSSREAARIAAADPNLVSGSCTMPCSSAPAGSALKAAADRMSRALLPGAAIAVTLQPAAGTNCNRLAEVSISGNYKYFFYRLLQSIGVAPSAINDSGQYSAHYQNEMGAPAGLPGLNSSQSRNDGLELEECKTTIKENLCRIKQRGQTVVEISLITPLVLMALYVPADFGVAFLTAHLVQNAVREGVRIGSGLTSGDPDKPIRQWSGNND